MTQANPGEDRVLVARGTAHARESKYHDPEADCPVVKREGREKFSLLSREKLGQREACVRCLGDWTPIEDQSTECPLCGEEVQSVARHLGSCDESEPNEEVKL